MSTALLNLRSAPKDWRRYLSLGERGEQGQKRDANDGSGGNSHATATLRRARKDRNDEMQLRRTNGRFAKDRERAKKWGRQGRGRTLKDQVENCD